MNDATHTIDLGDLRRVTPIDSGFGLGRGKPVDRHYIEDFVRRNAVDIRGRVLEVGEDTYTRRFGGDRVSESTILHVAYASVASLVGDLSKPETLPEDRFDCFVCTQTFNFIFDVPAAIRGAHRVLAPGGVLLATMAGIAQISVGDAERWGDFWRFTVQAAERAFGDVFGPSNVTVDYAGNAYAATSFLRGIALEEVSTAKLDVKDREYPIVVLVVARKD